MRHFLRVAAAAIFVLLSLARPSDAGLIAGFEAAGEFNSPPVMTFHGPAAAPPLFPYIPVQSNKYGTLGVDSSAPPTLAMATPQDLSAGNMLALSYGVTDSAEASNYALEFSIGGQTTISGPITIAPAVGSASDWHRVGVSLNYLRNLGMNTAAPVSVSILGTDFYMATDGNFPISFDNFYVDETFTASTPNFPVNLPATIVNCSTLVILNLGAQTKNGDNIPSGFHIYRAPDVAGAPATCVWSSMLYTTSTTYTDTVVPSQTYWYIAMPFDQAWNDTNSGGLMSSSADPARSSLPNQASGPNEALISSYSATMALKVVVPTAAAPNPPTGLTVTASCTTSISLSWNTGTVGAGGCNTIASYTVQRDSSCAFSTPITFADTNSTSYTDSTVVSGSSYYYRVRSNDNLGQNSAYTAACVFGSATGAVCTTPVPSTATPTMVPTAVPVPGVAQVYPNPFHPDRGECFRIGNVPDNTLMKVYDMVGAMVYSRTKANGKSTACVDNWDGFNNNGQKVVTGLYQVLLTLPDGTNTIYRVAVIRGN